MKKILFILKRKENFDALIDNHIGVSTGLYNSASFMHTMLIDSGISSNMEVVIDNNDIDRVVTRHHPTHVIIEALWVVPTKFAVLTKLHPTVTWIIRLHSEMPFLAGEGMAMDWLGEYGTYRNIVIGVNAPRMMSEVRFYLSHKFGWTEAEAERRVVYLPNYYPTDFLRKEHTLEKDHVDVGCFGAVRPLKNHMIQAVAALKFASGIGKKLSFHINAGRVEMKGEPVINNLNGLFQQLYNRGHRLVNHQWTPRAEFLKLCATMDIGMQVSFSETFNIVGADFVSQGVPFVGSSEIPWSSSEYNSSPADGDEICQKLTQVYEDPEKNVQQHQLLLQEYVGKTKVIWEDNFKE